MRLKVSSAKIEIDTEIGIWKVSYLGILFFMGNIEIRPRYLFMIKSFFPWGNKTRPRLYEVDLFFIHIIK